MHQATASHQAHLKETEREEGREEGRKKEDARSESHLLLGTRERLVEWASTNLSCNFSYYSSRSCYPRIVG